MTSGTALSSRTRTSAHLSVQSIGV
jgi:hypothetical protein